MKLFEKVKNMFTEEIEDEKPIRREVRHVEIPTPKKEEPKEVEEKKEDKLLFFDDKDFEDLEREEEKVVIKPQPKREEPLPYQGAKPIISEEPKKVFKPSPIISPVYGVLDKNYKKEDIVTKTPMQSYHKANPTVDDVRDRAFSTLEDDLKNEILEGDYITSKREPVVDELDIFKDIEEESIKETKEDIIKTESLIDDDFLDDTEYLAQKLEEQKRKLDEINDIINDNNISKKSRNVDEYLYREQEVEEKKEEMEEPTEEIEELDTNEEIIDSVIEELEEINELPVHEIEHPIIEEETSKSLDEVYKDTLEEIEEVEEKPVKKKAKTKKEDMSDSELLNLIDSMYEKSDDDE